jgi:cell division transport system permease protein
VKTLTTALQAILRADRQADRVVPPSGTTAHLTTFAAGAMAFLAVFALALALAAGRQAQSWGDELAGAATLRISASLGDTAARTDAALRVLETTPGVAEARALSDAEQADLLAPWLGIDAPVAGLPLPRLIEMQIDPSRFDAAGLRLRLTAEVPGAVLDDHALWRTPLAEAASRLRGLGWTIAILIAASLGAIITLASQAVLAANAQVISVLRLVGATDDYIAGAFVRRFTLRAAAGSCGGVCAGLIALWLMPSGKRWGNF